MSQELQVQPYSSSNARWWFLTYNNPPQDWEAAIDKLTPNFWAGQLEKGHEGTTHVQAILWYRDRVGVGFWRGKPCWHKPIGPKEAARVYKYCTKEDTRIQGPTIRGKPPFSLNGVSSGPRGGPDYTIAYELAKAGRIKEIDPILQIRHLPNLQRIAAMHCKSIGTSEPRGLWFYGKPGTGKSYYARNNFGPYYAKKRNKWWDGYSEEDTIILDDIGPSHHSMGGDILDWADEYAHTPEIKGSVVSTRYKHFIVTSNFLPSQIWDDPETCASVMRRFKFYLFHALKEEPLVGTDFGVVPQRPRDPFVQYLSLYNSQ